jgi:subtilisin family serine protease
MKSILFTLALLAAGVPAAGQLLPPLPQLPRTPGLTELTERARLDRLDRLDRPLQALRGVGEPLLDRAATLARLLQGSVTPWMPDGRGHAVLRDELLWIAPDETARQQALAQGWRLLEALPLDGLGLQAWRVAPPAGLDALAAQAVLQALGQGAEAELQHLYLPAGGVGAAISATVAASGSAASGALSGSVAASLGLIDGGVDPEHPALSPRRLQRWGCDGQSLPSPPSPHGTAVASLLVGELDGLRSAWPGAALAVADIYCGDPRGGSVARLVAALDWLVRQQVAVVNISLVGPPNRLLQQAVAAAQARGLILVAAVGNDGPAAPPLYPAAYPGVLAVSGVDARRRPLPEAGRGLHVGAVAQGSGLAVAQLGGGLALARGTSFAAPWLAGRIAQAWGTAPPSTARAQALLEALRAQLEDLGEPGPDPVFGHGYAGPRWQPRPPSPR